MPYGFTRGIWSQAVSAGAPPAAFSNPSPIAATETFSTTATSTTGSISVTAGQRIVVAGVHARGNASGPASPRTLTGVAPAGGLVGLVTFTVHDVVLYTDDADGYGGSAWVASGVASGSGTGTVVATYSGTTWYSIIQPFVLPSCSVEQAANAAKANAGTSFAVNLDATPATDDLAIIAAAHSWQTDFSLPTSYTQSGYLSASATALKLGWRNGSVAQANTITALTAGSPAGAAMAVLRRT